MLTRLLQRSLTPSISVTWRTAPDKAVSFHGSCRSSSSNRQTSSNHKSGTASAPKTKKTLFEELFPHEAKQSTPRPSGDGVPRLSPPGSSSSTSWASQHLPPDADHEAALKTFAELPENAIIPNDIWPLHSHATLVLSSASPALTESDFLRLGASLGGKKHVAGWVSGITRVVPERDPDTLAPLGRYYVLFESGAAAAAYREEARRVWGLARELGAERSRRRKRWKTLDEPRRRAVEDFTLVVPGQRWGLEFGPGDAELRRAGGVVDRLMSRAGSRFLVLVVVDGGRISADTLRTAIRDDGVKRNLAWRVKDLDGDGLMPFGKSVVKPKNQMGPEESLRWQGETLMADGEVAGGVNGDAEEEQSRPVEEVRRHPRFIVPFLDDAEARRFVRNWHRRKLTLRADPGDVEGADWEEFRTLNVSLLW